MVENPCLKEIVSNKYICFAKLTKNNTQLMFDSENRTLQPGINTSTQTSTFLDGKHSTSEQLLVCMNVGI